MQKKNGGADLVSMEPVHIQPSLLFFPPEFPLHVQANFARRPDWNIDLAHK